MARLEIDRDAKTYTVTLSRRNLLTLLHKLDWPGSARTIHNNHIERAGQLVPLHEGVLLLLRSEDDDQHYQNAKRGNPTPGPMHPETEAFLERVHHHASTATGATRERG